MPEDKQIYEFQAEISQLLSLIIVSYIIGIVEQNNVATNHEKNLEHRLL